MASVFVGLDREYDEYDTPRICGLFGMVANTFWLGSITSTAIAVIPVGVESGQMAYVTTYGFPLPLMGQVDPDFTAGDADATCRHLTRCSVFARFEKPICAAAAMIGIGGVELPTLNIEGGH